MFDICVTVSCAWHKIKYLGTRSYVGNKHSSPGSHPIAFIKTSSFHSSFKVKYYSTTWALKNVSNCLYMCISTKHSKSDWLLTNFLNFLHFQVICLSQLDKFLKDTLASLHLSTFLECFFRKHFIERLDYTKHLEKVVFHTKKCPCFANNSTSFVTLRKWNRKLMRTH